MRSGLQFVECKGSPEQDIHQRGNYAGPRSSASFSNSGLWRRYSLS